MGCVRSSWWATPPMSSQKSRTGLTSGRLAQWPKPNTVVMLPTAKDWNNCSTSPTGAAPTEDQWREFYAGHFIDPTQEKQGLSLSRCQEGLVKRCDDVMLKPAAVAIEADVAFVEWTLGLKIRGIEFVYPGVSRLHFDATGLIDDHRDYFDFVGPTSARCPCSAPSSAGCTSALSHETAGGGGAHRVGGIPARSHLLKPGQILHADGLWLSPLVAVRWRLYNSLVCWAAPPSPP